MKRVSDRIKKEVESLSRYYEVTKCYVRSEEVDCREIPKQVVDGRLINDVKVCNKRIGKCVEAAKGSRVEVIEAVGSEVYLIKDECEEVGKRDKLGYVITGKGEGRTIKSLFKGRILYIEEVLGERHDHYRIYLLVEGG